MLKYKIEINNDYDNNLDSFAEAKLKQNYLLPGENYQQAFARVACAYADDEVHAQRIYDYIGKQWFMPATPVLANGGAGRGLPISCFVNEAEDSMKGIADQWYENIFLASKGGGIGTYWSNLRSIGEKCGNVGTTSGIIPFIKVQDSLALAISQGSQRRGASAAYLRVDHPEIEEFIRLRKPTGGDYNRKTLNIHHGVVITDAFMEAVKEGREWHLRSPKDNHVVKTVNARALWQDMLTTRLETGEPYMLFIDNVNKKLPEVHRALGLDVTTSNLCSEITLPTGLDHMGKERTAVCCLSSLNLANYDEYKNEPTIVEDIIRFLDNVLEDFIERAPDDLANAKYAAIRERSIGLGTMGFHTYLQKKGVPFDSAMAKVLNKKMFENISEQARQASNQLAIEKGACPDAQDVGMLFRNVNTMAIAPNASTSIICGGVSPGIEPLTGNAYTQVTDVGSHLVKNKELQALLKSKGKDTEEVWSTIITNEGSVQHLDFLDEDEKRVFRTAWEMDQRWIVEHAADRTPYVSQAQSLNVFLPADVDKGTLHRVHWEAWQKGVKSLYYCRSKSIRRAENVSQFTSDCLACEG